jgi:hypothetical protein
MQLSKFLQLLKVANSFLEFAELLLLLQTLLLKDSVRFSQFKLQFVYFANC